MSPPSLPITADRPRLQPASEEHLLERGLSDFVELRGRDLLTRGQAFAEWVDQSSSLGFFQYLRHHAERPGNQSAVIGWGGQRYTGLNLASQDYLGLAGDERVKSAAAEACRRFGTHSAGSEPMGGGLASGKWLERELSEFLEHEHVVLFPTGWAAGYGAIKALVGPADHVVMDVLAHNCLQHGAQASGARVSYYAHNDLDSLEKRLKRIRSSEPSSGILAVTESLFSMDSDHPDLRRFVEICRATAATSFVDVAHDLGSMGPGGRGILAEHGVLGEIDIVMGSFSKTFASIGGFMATNSRAASYYVRAFSGSYTFSNYLTPAQIATVIAALAITRSSEGDRLRRRSLQNAMILRAEFVKEGITVAGRPSPIVLPLIGDEGLTRRAYRTCIESGVIVNAIEFPACRRGQARLRLQTSPASTDGELQAAARTVARSIVATRNSNSTSTFANTKDTDNVSIS